MAEPVEFYEPRTIAEAVAVLASVPDACCLAGGQTLVAGMNMGPLFRPPALVSLQRIDELKGITQRPDGTVVVGAMVTHRTVAQSELFGGGLEVVREAAGCIAHPAIRTMGTIGGSICHADPAADYPAVLVATDATVVVTGLSEIREIPAAEFFVDFMTTSIEPDELVTAITFPPAPADAVSVYEKFTRASGDFATVSVALALSLRHGRCESVRIALGSCGPTPVRAAAAEQRLVQTSLDESDIQDAGRILCDAAAPMDDVRGTADYKLMLIPRLLGRTIQRAQERAVAWRVE